MTTVADIRDYYAGLLIIQYRSKSNASAQVRAMATLLAVDLLPLSVQNAFDLDTAEGVQLDNLGQYAGVSRVGFDFSGPVVLGDTDFRNLIRLAIIQNNSGSSLSDIQALLQIYFADVLFVFDHLFMRMSYFLDSNEISTELAEFWVRQGSLPKPMGVQLSALIVVPTIDNWFGFRTYAAPPYNTHGFNVYSQYDLDCHFFNGNDIISP